MIPIYSGDWSGGGGWEPGVVWTFSVRPDLLPLGRDTRDSVTHVQLSWWSWDPSKTSRKATTAAWDGYHLPGVMEALILAGQVAPTPHSGHSPGPCGVNWVEVAP